MESLADQTRGEQQNPQKTAGNGTSRTFEFVRGIPGLIVYVRLRCGGGHSRHFAAAEVLDPDGSNPLLRIQIPLGVAAVEQICRLVRAGKHLELGEHAPE